MYFFFLNHSLVNVRWQSNYKISEWSTLSSLTLYKKLIRKTKQNKNKRTNKNTKKNSLQDYCGGLALTPWKFIDSMHINSIFSNPFSKNCCQEKSGCSGRTAKRGRCRSVCRDNVGRLSSEAPARHSDSHTPRHPCPQTPDVKSPFLAADSKPLVTLPRCQPQHSRLRGEQFTVRADSQGSSRRWDWGRWERLAAS